MSRLGEGAPPAGVEARVALARHLGVYSVGAALSLACSVALLPVFATQFSASQFGLVATAQVVVLAAATVARVGINSGMFRFLAVYHSRRESNAADAIVVTCLAASIASALVATLLVLAGLSLLGTRLPADARLVGILIAFNITVSAPREMGEFALRAKQQSTQYVLLSSSFVILSTVLTGALVVVARGGVPAVFAAPLLANVVIAPVALYTLRRHLKLKALSLVELKRALRFGVPGMPALLADWVTQYSDRFFLTRFSGLAQVGVYSMGYRIGLIEQQVLGAATQAAWDPFVLSSYSNRDGPRVIGRVATYFAVAGMALVVLISASAPTVFTVIHARHEYFAATTVVFLIAFANFFATLQYLFSAPTSITLRPEVGTLLRFLAALINTGLNILLIATFGMLGAAWATVLTFFISALVTEAVGRRLWRIGYEYRKLALIVGGGLLTQAGIQLVEQVRVAIPLGVEPVLAAVAFAAWLVLTRVVSRADLSLIRRTMSRSVAS